MYNFFFKRLIDLIFSIITLMILFPLLLMIAFAIKIDSKGNVFYCQNRVGKNGNIFKIFKFRTMINDADIVGSYQTSRNDSRITRLGVNLRKTSLDELPQCFNVILGTMSLVGPRPDVLSQKENYTDKEFFDRHKVKPGITGLAQCKNRHGSTVKSRKKYDIFYNKNLSFILDVKIVLWTIKILKNGSY